MKERTHPRCDDCGVLLAPWQRAIHTCFELRWIADAAQAFEAELARWLATPRGRFELWYAARTR